MTTAIYRLESSHLMFGPLLPIAGTKLLTLVDRAIATVMAAKSITKPCGHEIRVVHVPSGEVIFRKTDDCTACSGYDL
jgi:hypothetical protein